MVKGGTKRKPEMKKITNKASRATTFTKRRDGLYSKAAQLCLLSDARIAILATPSSSNSNASFFSFGHSSVDSVVSAYLSGQRLPPVSSDSKATREDLGICMARKDLGLGFWWDEDKLVDSKDPEELMEAMESMKVLMSHLKGLEDQTLTTTVDEDKVEISPETLDEWSEMELNQILKDCDEVPPLVAVDDEDVVERSPETLDEWSEMELNQLLEDCDDDDVPPPLVVVSNTDHKEVEEEDHNVSETTCNNNTFVSSLPDAAEKSLEVVTMDLGFDTTMFEGLISYDDEDPFESLPAGAVAVSQDEEGMNIDWDTIFAVDEEVSDEYKMYA